MKLPSPRWPSLRRPVLHWPVLHWPVLHWPSIRGRARADAGPLVLTAVVVAVVSALAGAVPSLLRSTADEAVRDAVRRAGSNADVTVTARWEPDDGETGRIRMPRLAEDVTALRERALNELGGGLRAALLPPVAGVITPTLKVTDGSVLRTLRLGYLSRDGGPAVTWLTGGEPGPTEEGFPEVAPSGPPWTVSIGLSETAAAAFDAEPGDHIPVADEKGNPKDVVVSGVFRPADPADPAWRLAPWLLEPVTGADGLGSTRFGGLLSAASLPDARLAFGPDDTKRTVWFSPDPDVLTWESADRIAATAVTLKATSASSSSFDTASTWNTQLDAVLRDVREQVNAASAQASVLLIAVLTVAVLVLLLAAGLVVHRRTPALAVARQRGTGLPVLAIELVIESATVALFAAGIGLAFARTLVSQSVSGNGPQPSFGVAALVAVVPVVLAAVMAAPVLAVIAAARATRDRRAPANRSARRRVARTAQMRRVAGELAVFAVVAAAFAALHQRGVQPGAAVWLPAAAPTLGVLAGALIVLRLAPVGAGFALRWAVRSTRPLAVFGASRVAETAGRVLPLVTMVVAAGLPVFAFTVAGTVEAGLRDGAWRTVGAEARLDLAPDSLASPELVRRIAGQRGVSHVVAGQVIDGARIVAEEVTVSPRLVIVDARAFRELLEDTPLPDGGALAGLESSASPSASASAPATASASALPTLFPDKSEMSDEGSSVPALVLSADGGMRVGMKLQLLRDDAPAVALTAIGTAPAIGGAPDVVLVDANALATAGMTAEPDTIWATGPGAAQAITTSGVAGDAVIRTEILRERHDAPLVSGLLRLAWASAVVMLALGLLGFTLSAAATAPDRWQTLTRLRTIGLRPRDARRVATAELLPLAAVAALAGPALGLGLAWQTLGPLALRLLTGQSADPAAHLPWPALIVVSTSFLVVALAVAPAESALRRRQHLSEVLRVGT
ncbi:putative ABC transport system permease protein [Actinoplanes lutulentus]|uniref:Putative ABC transport system permease protein n=1 Tax=Actinoplanes lutulentus TaxID=1287878 RepID=A0A327ZLF8_9ACTN|nr:FtsX-like permease family protein [Actinoplanes lutulentus]MBB2940846.1 putative ABC transport system permease protein [Actinoplanes lutulentus]RAK43155.1 putative ABC transport system permease protein [Actinoplanes lutulentus]